MSVFLADLNRHTNPEGLVPFGEFAIRWNAENQLWCATNTIDKGWNSTVYLSNKKLSCILGRLNVVVQRICCDEHSLYYHCVPCSKLVPCNPGVVRSSRVGDYEIRGNQQVAIAISVKNQLDSHYFTIDPDVHNNAYVAACAWAYEW